MRYQNIRTSGFVAWLSRFCPRRYYGPEPISQKLFEWAELHSVTINHIQSGNPAQNGYIERFNRTYHEDVLDQYWFYDLEEVRDITDEWMDM